MKTLLIFSALVIPVETKLLLKFFVLISDCTYMGSLVCHPHIQQTAHPSKVCFVGANTS